MAKKKEQPQEGAPVKILTLDQIGAIKWGEYEKYDFFDTPQEVRAVLVPAYLDWAYETYRREMWDKYKKRISQNHYALKTIGIDAQTFSMYKNGLRFPSMQNADIFAAFYGAIFYDICGYTRRLPRDRMLYQLADVWGKLDDRMQAELL